MKLLDLLQEDKIQLKQSGNGRWVAICPFHEGDRTPSFTVYPDQNYFCFGCRAWGDAVGWLVNYRNMVPSKAFELVGSDYKFQQAPKVIKVNHMAQAYPFLYRVAEEYHKFLLTHKGAMAYLESRGLTLDSIKKYKIGYTDGRVLNIKSDEEFELAQKVGVLTDKGRERLTHRITIPNVVSNNADYIMGRTVINDNIKYLGTGGQKPLQGAWDIRLSFTWFLVEGHFDWLILRQWGYPVVAIGGAYTSRDNISLLKNRRVIMIPDNDDEGAKAAEYMKSKLPNMEILDYSQLGVKDIGELGPDPLGSAKFEAVVREKLPWLITNTSATTLMTYFPTLSDTTQLPLI